MHDDTVTKSNAAATAPEAASAKQAVWPGMQLAQQAFDYWTDAWQRSVLFLDVLRQRGNNFFERAAEQVPNILRFRFGLIMNGRDLPRPVNYGLVRILPPPDVKIDPQRQHFIIFDPCAGQGPGIGGMKHDSEIGVALANGHPCYFIGFLPDPAHLGNGASMCAIDRGQSVASTMGFTAVDGLPMGTRTGALDPGVILYLLQHERMDAQAIEQLIYQRSGLLGVSGISSDMRILLASNAPAAREAVNLFVYRIGRELGSLAAALGGLDAVVFAAGIGEHSAEIRARACRHARWLGITLDEEANAEGGPRISSSGSAVSAWVIPTDEHGIRASCSTARDLDELSHRRDPNSVARRQWRVVQHQVLGIRDFG